MPNLQTDFEYLIQNCSPEDPRVIPALIQAYGEYTNHLVQGLFSEAAAASIFEKIFLNVSQSLDQYLIGSDFKLWFTKKALKECRSIPRNQFRRTFEWSAAHRVSGEPTAASTLASWTTLAVPKRKYFLPLVLRYNLNLTISEICDILRQRENHVLDHIDKGVLRLLRQVEPAWDALTGGSARANVHRDTRWQSYQGARPGQNTTPGYQAHLADCEQCQGHKMFVDHLEEVHLLGQQPLQMPEEPLLKKISFQQERKNTKLSSLTLKRPGQETVWVVMGVFVFLGLGWLFNRINPLIEVQQALQAQITPTLIAPLVPYTGEAHSVSTPIASTQQSDTSSESSWNPYISGQGGQLVFASTIRHLVENDTNLASDIFLFEMATGDVARISISSAGEEANNGSYEPRISGDGRFVVFTSWADNLIQQDRLNCEFWNTQSSCPDIFLHDRERRTTTLVSQTTDGLPGDNYSFGPEISQDGNLIAFWSAAGDLVPGDTELCGAGPEEHNCIDLFLYDIAEGSLNRVPIGRDRTVEIPPHYQVSISADGELLLVTLNSTDRAGVALGLESSLEVFLYHRSTGHFEPINIAADGTPGNAPSYAGQISPDGRWVVWASRANNLTAHDTNELADVYLKDRLTGEVVRISNSAVEGELDGDSGIISGRDDWYGDSLSISQDGEFILFASTATAVVPDQVNYCEISRGCPNVFLHNRRTGQTSQLNRTPIEFIPFLSISNDGNYGTFMAQSQNCNQPSLCLDIFFINRTEDLVAQLSNHGIHGKSELQAGWPSADQLTLTPHSRWVVGLEFSPDGQYLASGSRDQSVVIWSTKEEARVATFDGELVAFSPNGALLATADDDRSIYLWQMPEGQLTGVLRNQARARDLAFTPDGKTLVVAGSKGIFLWDLQERTLRGTFPLPARVVRSVAISPDGAYLAAGTDDETVWILSLPDGTTLARLGGHEDKVVALAFSPDGKYLASGSNDGTANLWRIQHRPEGSLDADRVHQFRHQDWVTSLVFSPDNQLLLTGSFDNSVALWDISTGELVDVPYRQTQSQVLSLAFSPTGDKVAAGNVRGEIHYWRRLPIDRD